MPDTPAAILTAAQARADSATPGPWRAVACPVDWDIAAAHQDVPALVMLGRTMLGLLDRLAVPGAALAYTAEEGYICGLCMDQAWREEEMAHLPGCLVLDVRTLLAGAGPEGAE